MMAIQSGSEMKGRPSMICGSGPLIMQEAGPCMMMINKPLREPLDEPRDEPQKETLNEPGKFPR